MHRPATAAALTTPVPRCRLAVDRESIDLKPLHHVLTYSHIAVGVAIGRPAG